MVAGHPCSQWDFWYAKTPPVQRCQGRLNVRRLNYWYRLLLVSLGPGFALFACLLALFFKVLVT